MTDSTVTTGQAATDSVQISGNTVSNGTTANAPGSEQGSSGSSQQTTGNGPGTGANESFFDPASIQDKPELLAAYKQMQGSYTKAMQRFAEHRPAIDAYQRFVSDPVGVMRELATQYGMQLVQPGQDQPAAQQDFKSWDDVKNYFFKEFEKEKLNPVVREVQSLKKQSIEMQLDSQFPDWRTYETEMMAKLREHPSLVNDPATLYRMSVPAEVIESRAMAAAMKKLQGKTDNAQVSGGTTVRTQQAPSGPMSFEQAVEFARKKVAGLGLTRPAG